VADLEAMIRRQAKVGNLTHLSLAYSPSKQMWQAAFRSVDSSGYQIAMNADPVEAMKKVLVPDRKVAASVTVEDLI
jgi:hypothetical protein